AYFSRSDARRLRAESLAGMGGHPTIGFQGFGGCSSASEAGPGNEMRGPAASAGAPTGKADDLLVSRCAGVGSSRGITSRSEDDAFLLPPGAGAGLSTGITAGSAAFGFVRRT